MTHAGVAGMFERIGARADVRSVRRSRVARRMTSPLVIDVQSNTDGLYFFIRYTKEVTLEVPDVLPDDLHLLLQATMPSVWRGRPDVTNQFLCGHDERSWFVAAIPDSERVATVQGAKDVLKPQAVWDAMRDAGVPMHERDSRVTDAFVRQGEWFFLPRPDIEVAQRDVLSHEPIRRGAGRPHICQFLYRDGGEEVYVSAVHPNGLTLTEYQRLDRDERARQRWRVMQRDARVFVRGAVQHPDHASVWLWCWHEVVPNRESESSAMQHVAFLD